MRALPLQRPVVMTLTRRVFFNWSAFFKTFLIDLFVLWQRLVDDMASKHRLFFLLVFSLFLDLLFCIRK